MNSYDVIKIALEAIYEFDRKTFYMTEQEVKDILHFLPPTATEIQIVIVRERLLSKMEAFRQLEEMKELYSSEGYMTSPTKE